MRLTKFILNNTDINTDLPAGTLLLDFIRYKQHLTGTKIGCREGDCGACTILVGEIHQKKVRYRSATSCLMALGNVHGKHIVTVEGVNMVSLNPIQQAIADEGGTQCGFCTPGFVVSLAGFCLSGKEASPKNAVDSINGNICRCTGYKSLERASARVAVLMEGCKNGESAIEFNTINNILPGYFTTISTRLAALSSETTGTLNIRKAVSGFLGGGTDLYVQQHDVMVESAFNFLSRSNELKGIYQEGNNCVVGASITVTDIIESVLFQDYFPDISRFMKLVSSTPIRNMATIAGNFINASPIGDLTIFFLALNARLVLTDGVTKRELPLKELYSGYKILNKSSNEYIEKIWFELPGRKTLFNFEKVSKRTHLDIASVNSAINITMEGSTIKEASLAAGGVGPIPMFLTKTSKFLTGNFLSEETIADALDIMQNEISPISDARGSEAYKRLLLNQLTKCHFISLFPFLKAEKLFEPVT